VRPLDHRAQIRDLATFVGILQQQTEGLVERQGGGVTDRELDIQWFGAAADDVEGLREAPIGHDKH
jgi:hypothetical protein